MNAPAPQLYAVRTPDGREFATDLDERTARAMARSLRNHAPYIRGAYYVAVEAAAQPQDEV